MATRRRIIHVPAMKMKVGVQILCPATGIWKDVHSVSTKDGKVVIGYASGCILGVTLDPTTEVTVRAKR